MKKFNKHTAVALIFGLIFAIGSVQGFALEVSDSQYDPTLNVHYNVEHYGTNVQVCSTRSSDISNSSFDPTAEMIPGGEGQKVCAVTPDNVGDSQYDPTIG